MADWYEVYDNEQVQLLVRRQVGRLLVILVLGLSAVVAMAPLLALYLPSLLLVAGVVVAGMLAVVVALSQTFLRLRSVVWCIKLSVHRVVGYDYARRKAVLAWPEIERIDVTSEGLVIAEAPREGRPGRLLRVPLLFPDYPRLSHRIVEYAEAHGIPVCLEGRPWQLLSVQALYPFMAECAIAADHPGGSFESGSFESDA